MLPAHCQMAMEYLYSNWSKFENCNVLNEHGFPTRRKTNYYQHVRILLRANSTQIKMAGTDQSIHCLLLFQPNMFRNFPEDPELMMCDTVRVVQVQVLLIPTTSKNKI